MKKLLLTLMLTVMSVMAGLASVVLNSTNFPDATFRAYVSEETGVAEGGTISDAKLQSVRSINVSEMFITSLKGVEYFTELKYLYCYDNRLASLDVSQNTALTKLDCRTNRLTNLDVSRNTVLTDLDCSQNWLTSLDVSGSTALTSLSCYFNQLTSLDVSHNTALTTLKCYNNQLMSLDLSKCTKLRSGYTSVGSQSKSVVASYWGSNHYSIDVPADFDISKVSTFKVNSVSVTPTLSNGQLVFTSSSSPTKIYYKYDTSNSVAGMMNVSVFITDIIGETIYYDLTISASGNGSASYSGTSIRNKSQTFSVVEGTNAIITFTPDTGYRIKSVKKNGTDVTSSVSNNKLTVSNISANTTIAVVFEEIPPTYYDLTISASGNGSASYNGTSVRGKSQTFSVVEGTNATITFTPDTGYRIKTVKKNGTNVTSTLTDNKLTVSNITENTTIAVVFEPIPAKTCELSISATGNGTATYDGTAVRDKSQTFTVAEGATATIAFAADEGHQLASVKQDGTDVTSSVADNSLTLTNITSNTTVAVVFEAIPVTTYTLTLKVSGNGSATYDGTAVRAATKKFTVEEGTNAVITFAADAGNKLSSVKVGSTNVTTKVKNNQYTVSNITANKTVTVVFVEDSFTENGITYNILANDHNEVKVVSGTVEGDFVLPETVDYDNTTWTVTAIDDGAFKDCAELKSLEIPATVTTVGNSLFVGCRRLGAVVWNPAIALTEAMLEGVSNPNLLLYVTAKQLAPASIHNVIVNGVADDIILADAIGGNDFHCPKAFTAAAITYSHHYSMTSGIGECQGWETIALPFDVQAISFGSTRLVPFSVWDGGKSSKPFWLYRLFEGQGFIPDGSIRKNVPYIISMPNNDAYDASYNISGVVTFSGFNATVDATTKMTGPVHNGKMFVPTYDEQESGGTVYALNVNNLLGNHSGAFAEGSVFTSTPSRTVHPFEAFMLVSEAQAKTFFSVFDDLPTMIEQPVLFGRRGEYVIYHLSGQMVRRVENATYNEAVRGLRAGVYLVNGRKIVLK